MATASTSWTRMVEPKNFLHVWTCLDFSFSESMLLESPNFTADDGISWRLRLRIEKEGHQLLDLMLCDRLPVTISVTPVAHFLDKHGKIFQPEGWGPVSQVSFGPDTYYMVSKSLPFDLSEQLGLLLHNGNLRIQLRFSDAPSYEVGFGTKIHDKNNNAPSTLISDLDLIFQNPTFSDITICSGAETFPAHKVILAGRSPVFRAMLEAPMIEAISNTVKIDEFCPEVVKGMLKYLYSDDVTVVTPALATEFLQIADFYNLDKLKCEAVSILSKNITLENAAEVLLFAITHSLESLKAHAIELIVSKDVFLTESSHLNALANTNMKAFLELVKDERMATKVPQLIDIILRE